MTTTDDREPTPPRDREALRADIERRRSELGDTVTALSARLDVKTRVSERVGAIVGDLKRTAQERPELLAGAAVGLVALVALVRKVRH